MSSDTPHVDGVWEFVKDEDLAEVAAKGTEEAFNAIFGKYGPDVSQFCCELAGAKNVEHVYLRTVARARKELRSGLAIKALKPWLFELAWAEAPPKSEDEIAAEPPPTAGGGDWIQNLSRDQRVRVVMHHLGGMAYEAIGNVLHISPKKVSDSVAEARYEMVKSAPAQSAECDEIRKQLATDVRPPAPEVQAHLAQCQYCVRAQTDIAAVPDALREVLPKLAVDKLRDLLKAGVAYASEGQGPAELPRGERGERRERDKRGERDRRGGREGRAATRAALAAHRRRRSFAAGGVLALLLFTAVLAATTGRLTPDGDPGHINAEKLSSVPFLRQGASGVGGVVVSCRSRTERCRPVPTPCRAGVRRRVRAAGCEPVGLPCRDGTVEPHCRPPRRPCRDGRVEPDCHRIPVPPRCRNGTVEPNCRRPCPHGTLEPNCSIVVNTRCADGLVEPDCTVPVRCRNGTVEPDCHIHIDRPVPRCPDRTVEPDCRPVPIPCPDGTVEPRCIPVVCTDRDHDCEHQYGLLNRGARSRLPLTA